MRYHCIYRINLFNIWLRVIFLQNFISHTRIKWKSNLYLKRLTKVFENFKLVDYVRYCVWSEPFSINSSTHETYLKYRV